MTNAQTSVGTTAVQLSTGDGDGQSIAVKNGGAGSIYVGGAGVTSATGFEIATGVTFTADLAPGEDLYGISASGTNAVFILRTRS